MAERTALDLDADAFGDLRELGEHQVGIHDSNNIPGLRARGPATFDKLPAESALSLCPPGWAWYVGRV